MFLKPPKLHTINLLLLGVLLCIFTAGAALAAPKVCKRNCPPAPEAPDNYVFWGVEEGSTAFFEHITEDSAPRTCTLTQVAPDFSSGTYDCTLGTYMVEYDLGNAAYIESCSAVYFTKSNDWYCEPERHDWFYNLPDLKYSYSWSGDCASLAGCDVVIVNRISMATMTSPLYSSVTIEAFVSGVTTTDGDPNPFSEPQNLAVDYVHVTKFAPKGKDKVLAICEAIPYDGVITFHTSLTGGTPD